MIDDEEKDNAELEWGRCCFKNCWASLARLLCRIAVGSKLGGNERGGDAGGGGGMGGG